jgi:hypothetical protein
MSKSFNAMDKERNSRHFLQLQLLLSKYQLSLVELSPETLFLLSSSFSQLADPFLFFSVSTFLLWFYLSLLARLFWLFSLHLSKYGKP